MIKLYNKTDITLAPEKLTEIKKYVGAYGYKAATIFPAQDDLIDVLEIWGEVDGMPRDYLFSYDRIEDFIYELGEDYSHLND